MENVVENYRVRWRSFRVLRKGIKVAVYLRRAQRVFTVIFTSLTMEVQVVGLCVAVLFTGSLGHDFPATHQQDGTMGQVQQGYDGGNLQEFAQGQQEYGDAMVQDYVQGQVDYDDANLEDYVLGEVQGGENGGKFPITVGEHVYLQLEDEGGKGPNGALGDGMQFGEGTMEQQEGGAEDGAIMDEEEGRKVYLMYMGGGDSEVEEMIAGEYLEGPSKTFLEMEEVQPEEGEGNPTEQNHRHHGLFPRGKRESEDEDNGAALRELEALFQQSEGEMEEEEEGKEGESDTVMVQWNNKYHSTLRAVCSAGYGLYRMRSVFNSRAKDRLFLFNCKRVAPACVRRRGYNPSKRHCKWYKVNKYGSNGGRHCPRNYYLAGVYSRASCKRDREWWGLCCNTPRICTKCKWTGYLNSYRKPINYYTRGVFGGMISYYNRNYMDRRYRLSTCSLRFC